MTTPTPLRVLLLEDDPADAELIVHALREAGFDPTAIRVDNEADFVGRLGPDLDVILADYNLPQFDAAAALRLARGAGLTVPFLIVSGSIGEERAVSMVKEGAADYLMKDRLARLGSAIRQALQQRDLEDSRREAELRLRLSEERYRALVENAHDVIYTHDLGGLLTSINTAGERMSGYRRDELVGVDLATFLPPDQLGVIRDVFERRLSNGGAASFDIDFMTKEGRLVPLEVNARLICEGDEPVGVQGIARDITERRQAEDRIAFLVYHDKLTGLAGRAMFEEILEMALMRANATGTAIAVLSIDLDQFKLVNDSLGHAAGDDLLCQVSERLRASARETDLVARLGGDEFLLLVAGPGANGSSGGRTSRAGAASLVATSVASRVQEGFGQVFRIDGAEVYVSASIGVAVRSADAGDAQTLIRNAHAAMYESKKAGPGGFVVFSRESVQPFTPLPFTTRLRKAVEHKRWALHFQPIVDLRSGLPVGAEALIRWRGPGGKLIPPARFIPLAEELGLIETIGDWVMEETFRHHRSWRELGLDMDVTFNLSPRQLWQPDLAEKILTALKDHGMKPSSLVVEITETTAAIDVERTQRILWDLHRKGIRVAIDDFGTGASSLSRLKDLPVDILKIDQSFVQGLPEQNGAGSMVSAVIQLAHSLGIVPLAEGIETLEQRRFLTERGCSLGQGFHFSRPVTARLFAVRYGPRRNGSSNGQDSLRPAVRPAKLG